MSKDKRDGWLLGLKVGDEVGLSCRRSVCGFYSIVRVKRITPSGRITTEDGTTFNHNGDKLGGESGFSRRYLVEITPENKQLFVSEKRISDSIYEINRELEAFQSWFRNLSRQQRIDFCLNTDNELIARRLLAVVRHFKENTMKSEDSTDKESCDNCEG